LIFLKLVKVKIILGATIDKADSSQLFKIADWNPRHPMVTNGKALFAIFVEI